MLACCSEVASCSSRGRTRGLTAASALSRWSICWRVTVPSFAPFWHAERIWLTMADSWGFVRYDPTALVATSHTSGVPTFVPASSTDNVGETTATSAGPDDLAVAGLPDAGDNAVLDEGRPTLPVAGNPPVAGPSGPTPEPTDGLDPASPPAAPPEPGAAELMLAPTGIAAGDEGPDEGVGATPAEARDAPLTPVFASVTTAAIITPMADSAAMPLTARCRTWYETPFEGLYPNTATVAVCVD